MNKNIETTTYSVFLFLYFLQKRFKVEGGSSFKRFYWNRTSMKNILFHIRKAKKKL